MRNLIFLSACLLFSCAEEEEAFSPEKVFVKYYGEDGANYAGIKVASAPDGGFYIGASARVTLGSISPGSPTLPTQGVFGFFKTDALGNREWSTEAGTGSIALMTDMKLDLEGNLVACGVKIDAVGSTDARVVKCSAEGTVLWEKNYSIEGSNVNESASGIAVAQNGDYLVIGKAGNSDADIAVMRLQASTGDIIWQKSYGASGLNEEGYAIVEDTDGSLIWLGGGETATGQLLRLIKSNAEGNIIWDYQYPGTATNQSGAEIIRSSIGYVILATSDDNPLLAHFDKSGRMLWESILGFLPMETAVGLSATADGGYLITGSTRVDNTLNEDMLLIKTNGSGEEAWRKTFGGNKNDFASSSLTLTDGSAVILGTTSFESNTLITLIKTNEKGEILK